MQTNLNLAHGVAGRTVDRHDCHNLDTIVTIIDLQFSIPLLVAGIKNRIMNGGRAKQ